MSSIRKFLNDTKKNTPSMQLPSKLSHPKVSPQSRPSNSTSSLNPKKSPQSVQIPIQKAKQTLQTLGVQSQPPISNLAPPQPKPIPPNQQTKLSTSQSTKVLQKPSLSITKPSTAPKQGVSVRPGARAPSTSVKTGVSARPSPTARPSTAVSRPTVRAGRSTGTRGTTRAVAARPAATRTGTAGTRGTTRGVRGKRGKRGTARSAAPTQPAPKRELDFSVGQGMFIPSPPVKPPPDFVEIYFPVQKFTGTPFVILLDQLVLKEMNIGMERREEKKDNEIQHQEDMEIIEPIRQEHRLEETLNFEIEIFPTQLDNLQQKVPSPIQVQIQAEAPKIEQQLRLVNPQHISLQVTQEDINFYLPKQVSIQIDPEELQPDPQNESVLYDKFMQSLKDDFIIDTKSVLIEEQKKQERENQRKKALFDLQKLRQKTKLKEVLSQKRKFSATKIQSCFRGYKQRKAYKILKEKHQRRLKLKPLKLISRRIKKSFASRRIYKAVSDWYIRKKEEKLNLFLQFQVYSANIIQKTWRGYRVRKNFSQLIALRVYAKALISGLVAGYKVRQILKKKPVLSVKHCLDDLYSQVKINWRSNMMIGKLRADISLVRKKFYVEFTRLYYTGIWVKLNNYKP